MKGYVFDPSRLRLWGSISQDRASGELLRDAHGGDIFAEVRAQVRLDPQLRAMLVEVAGPLTSPTPKGSDR